MTFGIRSRIALPFTLLVVAATLGMAFVSVSLVSRALEARLVSQMTRASEMLSNAGFATNRAILDRLKLILEADIVTYTTGGIVIASTLDAPATAELERLVRAPAAIEHLVAQHVPLVLRDVVHAGHRYKVAYRQLRTPADTVVAFVVGMAEIERVEAAVTRAVILMAVLVVVVMGVVSQLVARSITTPLEQLVAFTKRLGSGHWTRPPPARGGDEIGTLARAFDEMVERLHAFEERLVRSERLAAAGRIAAGIAHDIRNPLTAIKMHAQLLRTRLQAGQSAGQLVDPVLREIDRVEWVVKGLLDLVRPGQLDLEAAPVSEVIERALALLEPQLTHRKVAVERRLAADLPMVLLDADRIAQALLNLILNAADAMPEGGTVTISTNGAADRHTVQIEILDEGEGLDPGIRAKLFEPFVTTKRGGVGLGLVNAQRVVEAHGGTITLRPRDGRGTCAVVTLPLTPPLATGVNGPGVG